MWYEEMINNRNKSVVTGMQWSKDGTKICICYQDGAVILGSVDGNRIWGKELKDNLSHVVWSPDSKFILLATSDGKLQLYDNNGSFFSKMPTLLKQTANIKIAALGWYNGQNGYLDEKAPTLAICYESGHLQLQRSFNDANPILVETNLQQIKMEWNINGSLIALCGIQVIKNSQGEEKETCAVQLWSPYGELIKSLKVPGKKISSLSWESSGIRLAFAVDTFIYFANIRPDYKWSFFSKSCFIYSYINSESSDANVVFWNSNTNEKRTVTVPRLHLITAYGDYCAVISVLDNLESSLISICNSIGAPIETRVVEFIPKYCAMSKTDVVLASSNIIFHWTFKSNIASNVRKEKMFHVDDVEIIGANANTTNNSSILNNVDSHNPIMTLAISDYNLIVGRASGSLYQYSLPTLELTGKYSIPIVPSTILINCNSTRIIILESSGVLKLFDLENSIMGGPQQVTFLN